jgi:hypothetical protein
MSLVHIFVLWRQIVDVTWRITHWLVIRLLFNCLHASTWNDVVITIRCQLYKRSDNDFKKLHLLFMLLNVLIFFLLHSMSVKKKLLFLLFSLAFVTWFGRAVELRTHFTYTFDLFSFLFSLSLSCSNGHAI